MQVQSLGWEDPLEEGIATAYSCTSGRLFPARNCSLLGSSLWTPLSSNQHPLRLRSAPEDTQLRLGVKGSGVSCGSCWSLPSTGSYCFPSILLRSLSALLVSLPRMGFSESGNFSSLSVPYHGCWSFPVSSSSSSFVLPGCVGSFLVLGFQGLPLVFNRWSLRIFLFVGASFIYLWVAVNSCPFILLPWLLPHYLIFYVELHKFFTYFGCYPLKGYIFANIFSQLVGCVSFY